MSQQQFTEPQQPTTPIAPIDPKPILQSESPTGIILAIAVLISILLSSVAGLVQVIMVAKVGLGWVAIAA